jgi:TRAP-type transport system small permease protein
MIDRREQWEGRANAVLGIASSVILFALMVMTFVDVLCRYVFNSPLRWTFELTELALLVLIFAGLPLVSHGDEHVTMDFIDHMISRRARSVLERVVQALCAAVMFFLAWQLWRKAGVIAGYGDATDVLRIAVAPFVYFMSAMLGLTGVVHAFKVFVLGSRRSMPSTS